MHPSEPNDAPAGLTSYFDSWAAAVDTSKHEPPSPDRTTARHPFGASFAGHDDTIFSASPPPKTDTPSTNPFATLPSSQELCWREFCWAPQWEKIGGDPRPRPMQVARRRSSNPYLPPAQTTSPPTTPFVPPTYRRKSSGVKALRVLGAPTFSEGNIGPRTPDEVSGPSTPLPPAPLPPRRKSSEAKVFRVLGRPALVEDSIGPRREGPPSAQSSSLPSTPHPLRRKPSGTKALRVLGEPSLTPESIGPNTSEPPSRSSSDGSRKTKRGRLAKRSVPQQTGDVSREGSLKGSSTRTGSSDTKKSAASSKSSFARMLSRPGPDMRLLEMIEKGISPLQRSTPQKSPAVNPTKHPEANHQQSLAKEGVEQAGKAAEKSPARPQVPASRSDKSMLRSRSRERKRPPAVSWSRHSEQHQQASEARPSPVLSTPYPSPSTVHFPSHVGHGSDRSRGHSSTHSHGSPSVASKDQGRQPEQSDSPSVLPTLSHKRSRPSYLRSLSSRDKLFRTCSFQKSESGTSVLSSPGPATTSGSVTPIDTPASDSTLPASQNKLVRKQRRSFLRWLGFGSPTPLAAKPESHDTATSAAPPNQPAKATAKVTEYFGSADSTSTVARTGSKGKGGKSRSSKKDGKAIRRVASDDDFPRKAIRKATTRYHPKREADVYSLSSNKSRHTPPETQPRATEQPPASPTHSKSSGDETKPATRPANAGGRPPPLFPEARRLPTPPLPATRPRKPGFFASYAPPTPYEDPLITPPTPALKTPLSAPADPAKEERDWYRLRMDRILNLSSEDEGEVPERSFDWNVPEHLPNSPLCPLHPKFRGGRRGICVFHGRVRKG